MKEKTKKTKKLKQKVMRRVLLAVVFLLSVFAVGKISSEGVSEYLFADVLGQEGLIEISTWEDFQAIDLVGFDFEDEDKRDSTDFENTFYSADYGIDGNKDVSELKLNGGANFTGFVQGSGGAGTHASNANNWHDGGATNYWTTTFSTEGYEDLTVSSKQYGSATGPRDFKVQWSLDGSAWTDVAGSAITVATNWTSGVLDNVSLPSAIEDQPEVHLRWIMTSNTSVGGETVAGTGTNRIDNIFVVGKLVNISSWDFEDSDKRGGTNFVNAFYSADEGIDGNKDVAEIKLNGASFTAFVHGSGGAGTHAPNANNWHGGEGLKYWEIGISTSGYRDLTISSRQYGSATGPRDFKVQWSLDGSAWTDVAGSEITVATNWTSGVLDNVSLPAATEDQPEVHLRWIMTSNTSVDGGIVGSTGTNRIDDIFVGGKKEVYNLTYSAGDNGSLSGNLNQNVYFLDDGSPVLAVADSGYHFSSWSDGVTANPRTDLSVTEAIDVTANFEIDIPFSSCGDTLYYEGHGYETVQIGSQCWIKENLRYLPSVSPSGTGSSDDPHYYVYDNQGTNLVEAKANANYLAHGVLYNLPAATSACPSHFHLPTDDDYKVMEMFLGMDQEDADDTGWRGTDEANQLKSEVWGGLDTTEFSAKPGGMRNTTGIFNAINSQNYLWTSTEHVDNSYWGRALHSGDHKVFRSSYGSSFGFSVRCMLNQHTLTYTAGPNGSISGDSTQIINWGEDGSSVTANPDSGHNFVDWSDGVTDNPRTDLSVTESMTITANFAPVPVRAGGGGGSLFLIDIPENDIEEDIEEDIEVSEPKPEPKPEFPKSPFIDTSDHWGEHYIDQLYSSGYVEGYDDGTFKPDQFITRAEASKLVALWLDENIDDTYCRDDLYVDVSCDEWYGKFISYMHSVDILEGYGAGSFGPEQNISRAEALKIILYAKELQDTNIDDVSNPFSDVRETDWFYNLVVAGSKLLIVEGYKDGTFGPNNPITRAEFAKIFSETLL